MALLSIKDPDGQDDSNGEHLQDWSKHRAQHVLCAANRGCFELQSECPMTAFSTDQVPRAAVVVDKDSLHVEVVL